MAHHRSMAVGGITVTNSLTFPSSRSYPGWTLKQVCINHTEDMQGLAVLIWYIILLTCVFKCFVWKLFPKHPKPNQGKFLFLHISIQLYFKYLYGQHSNHKLSFTYNINTAKIVCDIALESYHCLHYWLILLMFPFDNPKMIEMCSKIL